MALSTGMTLTVGDRRRSLEITVRNPDGTPMNLTGTAAFRMNLAAGTPKIVDQPMVIPVPANGMARYDWAAADVDVAGVFYGWMIYTEGGKTETFPYGGRNPGFRIEFRQAA